MAFVFDQVKEIVAPFAERALRSGSFDRKAAAEAVNAGIGPYAGTLPYLLEVGWIPWATRWDLYGVGSSPRIFRVQFRR